MLFVYVLLLSKLGCVYVPHLAKTTSRCQVISSGGICEDVDPAADAEIFQLARHARPDGGSTNQRVNIRFAAGQDDYALSGGPRLKRVISQALHPAARALSAVLSTAQSEST